MASKRHNPFVSSSTTDWQPLVQNVCTKPRPLIAIVGPTASGKTGFSLQVASFLREIGKQAEIVNADSRQFYTGIDIGSAMPTREEFAEAAHHLFNILKPTELLSAAKYRARAEEVIAGILDRGHIPILVGGSMLFVSSVVDGLTFAPKMSEEVRERIEAEYDMDNGEALYAELQETDPETAASFHKNNKPYVVRAVEILRETGKKPSEFKLKDPQFDVCLFGMKLDKEVLDQRIATRTRAMLEQGWVEEVEALLQKHVPLTAPAMKSVGYPELADWIMEGKQIPIEELASVITDKTRQYAKRQMTWWKGDERIHWITPVQ